MLLCVPVLQRIAAAIAMARTLLLGAGRNAREQAGAESGALGAADHRLRHPVLRIETRGPTPHWSIELRLMNVREPTSALLCDHKGRYRRPPSPPPLAAPRTHNTRQSSRADIRRHSPTHVRQTPENGRSSWRACLLLPTDPPKNRRMTRARRGPAHQPANPSLKSCRSRTKMRRND